MGNRKYQCEITIDIMLIIGKYFQTTNDYINVMKVSKKYQDLTEMYHFNPISDCSIFRNIETQYLYHKEDDKKSNMYGYVYWYSVGYRIYDKRRDKETYKRISLCLADMTSLKEIKLISIKQGQCEIKEGIHEIGSFCFFGNESITSIKLPTTMRRIGDRAFSETNISTITIPEGVTTIGDGCFENCHFF